MKIVFGMLPSLMLFVIASCGSGLSGNSDAGKDPVVVYPATEIDAALDPVAGTTKSGPVIGYEEDGIQIFKGIPFAAAPVGALRWKAPEPVAAWTEPRAAQTFGFDCLQNRPGWDKSQSSMAMNEDCLFLNVWTPQNEASQQSLPVMVFIHGGGFVIGSGSQSVFDGSALAKRGVVVVTFNYRVGRFGFFAHPELTEEAAGKATGNFALMDQLAALSWVQDNIALFGGDSNNVTVFGESAGGGSIASLMIAEEAEGLFHKAIIQSGSGRIRWAPLKADGEDKGAEAAGVAFAQKHKLNPPTLSNLRQLSAEAILGEVSFSKLRSKIYAGPMIDGVLVDQNFVEGFSDGRQRQIPMMIGFNSGELSHLGSLPKFLIGRSIKKGLKPHIKEVRAAYGSGKEMNLNLINDWGFLEPAWTMAKAHADAGATAYLYEFDYVPTTLQTKYAAAPHASELPFVFDTLDKYLDDPSAQDREVARRMADAWVQFAKTGSPVTAHLPEWQPQDSASSSLMRITQWGGELASVRNPDAIKALSRAADAK